MDRLHEKALYRLKKCALNFFNPKSNSRRSAKIPGRKAELLAEEATNLDNQGPSQSILSALVELAENQSDWNRIKGVINQRLSLGIRGHGKDWIYLYKVAVVIEYLLKHGPFYLIDEIANSFMNAFLLLCNSKSDKGGNVRNKSRIVVYLLQTPEKLLYERWKLRGDLDQIESDARASGAASRCPVSPSSQGILVSESYYSQAHSPTYDNWEACDTEGRSSESEFVEPGRSWCSNDCDSGSDTDAENTSVYTTGTTHDRNSYSGLIINTRGPCSTSNRHLAPLQLPSSFVLLAEQWKEEHETSKLCSQQYKMRQFPGAINMVKLSPPPTSKECA